jgi:Ca2+-transporting ATPase
VDEGILTRAVTLQIVVLAAVLTGSALGAAGWVRAGGGPWQTVLFVTIAFGQLGLAVTTRSDSRPARQVSLRGNRLLAIALFSSLVLVLAAVYLPVLQVLLGTAALSPAELVVATAAATAPALVALPLLAVSRRLRRTRRGTEPP